MVFCKQKHKHCFAACCASLLNKSTVRFQESMVRRFPKELQKGTGDGVRRSVTALRSAFIDTSSQPTEVQPRFSYRRIVDGLFISEEAPRLSRGERTNFSRIAALTKI
jgi:hypothetical protein